jgi:acyl dehydratase
VWGRLLPDELKQFIGLSVDTSVIEIEKEPIRRFADAVGETNPLYWDEEYARKSRHGGIVAPPGFLSSLWFSGRPVKWGPKERPTESLGPPALMAALEKAGYTRILDTGIDYDFYGMVKAGQTITAVSVVKDIMERSAKEGKVIFLVTETTYTDEDGKLAAKARSMTIHQ